MSQSKKNSRQLKQPQTSDPKRWLWPALAGIVIVVILGLVILSQVSNQSRTAAGTATSYPLEVSLSEAVAKRDAGAFMLDVRTQSEWTEYHVPGSTLIPLDTLASRLNELPRDKEIIVVCRSGNRSAQGRDILRNAGFTTVTSLSGGLSNWKAQGYPTVNGQP